MKTKTIVTAMLLATAYILLVNLMSLFGMYQDEMVKVGWYSEFGGNSMTGVYSVYVWLNLPFTVCFYSFTTLFFYRVKAHANKWLGRTAFALWCISLVPVLLNMVSSLYIVTNFSGDEMYRSLENYWQVEGKYEHSLLWLWTSFKGVGYYLRLYGYWALYVSYLAFAIVFALLIKKDKALGITGVVALAMPFLTALFQLPYGSFIHNLCWIALCTVVLWSLHRSSPDKPFVLS